MILSILPSISVSAATDYNSYKAKVDNLNKLSIPLQKQSYRVVKNGNSYKSKSTNPGICNIVAATQLLNRRLAYDIGSSLSSNNVFTMSDVISACGNTVTAAGVDFYHTGNCKMYYGNGYEYDNATSQWYKYTFTAKNGNKYKFVQISKPTMTSKYGINSDKKFREFLANLLLEHPEGVHYRGSGHCIVFTDFVKSGDDYIFYAIDGVDVGWGDGRELYTKTWQYSDHYNSKGALTHKGAKNLYDSMSNSIDGYIAYIDTAQSTTTSKSTTTTKPATTTHTCTSYQTKNGKPGVCKVCGKAYKYTLKKLTTQVYELKDNYKSSKIGIYKEPYEDAAAYPYKVTNKITVVGYVTNAYKNKWYAISYYDNSTKKTVTAYVYAKDFDKKYQKQTPASSSSSKNTSSSSSSKNTSSSKTTTSTQSTAKKPSIDVTRYPTSINQGSSYGLRGTIYANGAKTTVTTEVINKNGKAVLSTTDTISANSTGNIKNMNANNKITFNTLGAGTYTLKFTAKNSAGKKTWSKEFTVKGKSSSSSSSSSSKNTSSSKATTSTQSTAKKPSIDVTSYPTSINQGSSYGLRGTIYANGAKTTVTTEVINKSGKAVLSTADTISANSTGNIKNMNANNKITFNTLGAGTYTLKFTAKNSAGTKTWSKEFTVKGKSSSSSSSSSSSKPKSTLNVNLTKYPTSINKGKSFGLRGSVTSNYKITTVIGTIHDSKGNVVQRTTDYPNSTSMDIRYANVNNNLIFNKLAKGYYVLQVTATDTSGTQKVWSSGFNVV